MKFKFYIIASENDFLMHQLKNGEYMPIIFAEHDKESAQIYLNHYKKKQKNERLKLVEISGESEPDGKEIDTAA